MAGALTRSGIGWDVPLTSYHLRLEKLTTCPTSRFGDGTVVCPSHRLLTYAPSGAATRTVMTFLGSTLLSTTTLKNGNIISSQVMVPM